LRTIRRSVTCQKVNNYAVAKKELEYALKLSPNYPHADEIKQALAQAPQGN